MQVVILHDSETEDVIGMVTSTTKADFVDLYDEVYKTWSLFNSEGLAEDCTIEDFVDFHNESSQMIIDWVVSDFIQL